MARCPELADGAVPGEWWRVDLPLPELLSRIDFVTMDTTSGAVDNNGCVRSMNGAAKFGVVIGAGSAAQWRAGLACSRTAGGVQLAGTSTPACVHLLSSPTCPAAPP